MRKPLECDNGNKAMLTVVNYTDCTPNIEVDGDVVAIDLGANILEDAPGDSVLWSWTREPTPSRQIFH